MENQKLPCLNRQDGCVTVSNLQSRCRTWMHLHFIRLPCLRCLLLTLHIRFSLNQTTMVRPCPTWPLCWECIAVVSHFTCVPHYCAYIVQPAISPYVVAFELLVQVLQLLFKRAYFFFGSHLFFAIMSHGGGKLGVGTNDAGSNIVCALEHRFCEHVARIPSQYNMRTNTLQR